MKIALYGYGRMGKAIEKIAVERGHSVVLKVDASNAGTAPTGADVAIEFSTPDQAMDNMRLCMEHGVPVVVGTTGWYDQMTAVKALVDDRKGTLLWASNFSIGVNLFFRMNRMLASLMDKQPAYSAHIDEIHHTHKLDAPSGTAITLARDIDLKTARYSGYELREAGGSGQEQVSGGRTQVAGAGGKVEPVSFIPVPIRSERVGEVPGKHAVTWSSANDRIVINHEAFDRTGFALGAVIAAEWIQGRKGLFTMDDVMDAS